MIVLEELAKTSMAAAWPVFEAATGPARVIELFGTEEQRERYLPAVARGEATIAVATKFRAMPESVQERMPLIQKETQGTVVFDVKAGRVAEVRLTVDRTLENHQGPGSSYHFESTYTEQHVAD